ncbi:calcium-binding protein [Falsiroseomonas oryzae]|uniref:calcium-binding protein n=1 Tax=Falsiroseomonas oryzae TaxID=2766473 RepID=UPI0022EB9E26|nr:calcium-binding protein [Roseomonas sp. MO-31]
MAIISGNGDPNTITTTTNSLNPLLLATNFADSIAGLGGADSLAGGLGNDTLLGGDGNDTLDGEGDGDRLDGGDNADLLRGGTGGDTLLGGTGNDTLNGGAGPDSMDGGDNDDRFLIDGAVLGEVDLIDGGLGRDTLDFTAWATLPFLALDLAAGTLRGGNAANVLLLMAQIEPASMENAIGSGFGDLLAGDGDANLLEGRDGADTLQGGTSNDTLLGGAQNDLLQGGAGNDSLNGGTGADTIEGGDGVDWVGYADAASAVSIQLNNDTAGGFGAAAGDWIAGVENIDGSAHADDLWGVNATAFNHLRGRGGNDQLFGGFGDTLEGGSGADSYYVTVPGVTIVDDNEAGVADTVFAYFTYQLPDLVENLTLLPSAGAAAGFGNGRNNHIAGNDSANILAGHDGDDRLDGGGGADVMIGGGGSDQYIVDDAGDVVVGDQFDRVFASASFALEGTGVRFLQLTGTADIDGTGSAERDDITGNAGANLLRGLGSPDTLLGEGGNDTLEGGDGGDGLQGGSGADLLLGGAGNDGLVGNEDADTLYGEAGNDFLVGGGGEDWLSGGAGNDTLDGEAGADTLQGGLGDDRYIILDIGDRVLADPGGYDVVVSAVSIRLAPGIEQLNLVTNDAVTGTGNAGDNAIIGNIGNDRLLGRAGADGLYGQNGDDLLMGEEGADTLSGGSGADRLLGGAGNDLLDGNDGPDVLTGGEGADSFRFSLVDPHDAADRIRDFDRAEGDRILLHGSGLPTGALDAAAFRAHPSGWAVTAAQRVTYETDSGRLWFDPDGSGAAARQLVAQLTGAPDLTAADIWAV